MMATAFRLSVAIFAASLSIFFLIISSFAEKAPYNSFAKNATLAPATGYYDYIIIGGGTAGCPLAATLSASAKVLLLERGGLPYNNPNVTNKAGFIRSLQDTSATSVAQMFTSTDGVFNHRARVLGGGSAINAGFYTHASSEYVRNVGWDPVLVNDSYQWVEKKVVFWPRLLQWQTAVRDGLLAANVTPYNGFTYEHLPGTKIGGSIFDENGTRHTSADLLEYADPTNIIVYLHATVQKILFNTSPGQRVKAYGVVFKDSNGKRHEAYLNSGAIVTNEIILSAGAMGSPQLLMLSGIGPAQKLRALGKNIVLDQASVGQGMSDNPANTLLIPTRRPIEMSLVQVVGISNVGSYIEALSVYIDPSSPHNTNPTNQTGPHFGSILQKIRGPFSTGYMEVKSKDPNDTPIVTFNYFKDPRDLQRCVGGLRIMKKVVESPAISEFRQLNSSFESLMKSMLSLPINLRKKNPNATHSLEQFCKDAVVTVWHYHGGCHVDRVVDRDYRVLGVDSLRVVDGSTFYNSPGTNPQATLMMLGRYVGQKILQQRNFDTESSRNSVDFTELTAMIGSESGSVPYTNGKPRVSSF